VSSILLPLSCVATAGLVWRASRGKKVYEKSLRAPLRTFLGPLVGWHSLAESHALVEGWKAEFAVWQLELADLRLSLCSM
jgi:hypothetical protein